ncbi:hypothetical protein AGMMS49992_19320 [Clostridia bacterium]|nr:hypothetical protein AGMMS49992_19320 [Clostridia bacterium]
MSKKHRNQSPFNPQQKCIPMTIVQLPIEKLFVEGEFQRDLREYNVNLIVENFDEMQVNPIKVHKEPKGYSILNGQHTSNALIRKGYTHAPCIVYSGLTLQEKAHLFRTQDEFKNRITLFEQFKAAAVEGDPDCVTLKQVMETAGIPDGRVNAVAALKKLAIVYNPQDLAAGLRLAVVTWPDKVRSIRAEVFGGIIELASFCNHRSFEIPETRFAERVGKKTMKELISSLTNDYPALGFSRNATATATCTAMREILTDAYNHQLRNGRIPRS